MVASIIGRTPTQTPASTTPSLAAAQFTPVQRQHLSLQVLSRTQPLAHLAAEHGVSRKFCYQQAHKAQAALDQAFDPPPADPQVLFHLPVTAAWIEQFVLAQVLIGHTSLRGVLELLDTLLDYRDLSLGSVHNLLQQTIEQARQLNAQQDRLLLPAITVGAHDEIFQGRQPVLVGVDLQSTYCYLLVAEDHRDETTWGVHLLDLSAAGLNPDYTVADGGLGLRAGQAAAWPTVPCHGDVFHPMRQFGELVFFLERRATAAIAARQDTQQKLENCWQTKRVRSLSVRLGHARREEQKAVALADDLALLERWLRQDVLAVAGEDLAGRREEYDFIVEELRKREEQCEHRLKPLRRMLEGQREQLLAFVGVRDQEMGQIAEMASVPLHLVAEVCRLEGLDRQGSLYWQRRGQLQRKLGESFHGVERAVREVLAEAPRASSVVENLNSRLRCYLFLRRQAGGDWLHLLRFFFNHRPYVRSRRAERAGRSPAELLGQPHPHWLEMLGYQRFHRD
jgi:hypothetical protein